MALKDTLKRLQSDHAAEDDFERERPRLIREWQQAVVNVLEMLRNLLEEYATDGSMSFTERPIQLTEETLGSYQTSELSISAGSVSILVRPVGRLVAGATGRLDVFRQGRQGEDQRLFLLRWGDGDGAAAWHISLPPEPGSPILHPFAPGRPRRFAPLTKESLEQGLDFLLR